MSSSTTPTESSSSSPSETPKRSHSPDAPSQSFLETVQTDKETFLNMNLDEKRSLYKCEDDFVTLAEVSNWSEYFEEYNVEPSNVEEKPYEVNETLNSKVSLWVGDITTLEIDCIVNAANKSLHGGSGVDGAIHSAAGRKLMNECRILNGCDEGQAKITAGYKLPAKYIIHTVGPEGEIPEILQSAYLTSLQLMIENKLRSIAFPCISTGVYGYPPENAAKVALRTAREFMEANADKIDRIIFAVYLREDMAIYEDLMQKYFPLE